MFRECDFRGAAKYYKKSLAEGSASMSTYINLGIALMETGDVEGSLQAFGQPVRHNKQSPEAHVSYASALLECGRLEAAHLHAGEAIRLRKDFLPAHLVFGMVLAAQGHWQLAVDSAGRGLTPKKTQREILSALAARFVNIGFYDRALACFEKLLEQEPGDVGALHFVASLSGHNPDHPNEEYIRQLFDEYAETFDRHLQTSLGYTVPREVAAGLRAECSLKTPWDVLDLGCGTGLVGLELAPYVRTLVGVDVSTKMIDQARRRNVYTALKAENLLSVLEEVPISQYDAVVAADVLLYVGKLDSLMPLIARALRPGGIFAFSTEATELLPDPIAQHDAVGYRLTCTGRYSHTREYLESLALRNGFAVKVQREIQLRTERRRPVDGLLSIWSLQASH